MLEIIWSKLLSWLPHGRELLTVPLLLSFKSLGYTSHLYSWYDVLFAVTSINGPSKLCRLWEGIGGVTAPNRPSVSSKWFDTYVYRSLHSHRSLGSTGTFSGTWSSLLSDMRSDSWPWTKTGSEVKGEWPAFMSCLSSLRDSTKRFTLVLFTHSHTHTHTHTDY